MLFRDVDISKDSVFYAESNDIKLLVRFHENAILEFLSKFIIVGGTHMRGWFVTKIEINATIGS